MPRSSPNKHADVMAGPPAPVEPNPSSFNRACPVCGWESEESIEGCATKFAKCPKCGSDFDQQPFVINTQPAELELLTPRVGKEKNMRKPAQVVQTNIDTNAIVQMLISQGVDPQAAQQAATMIEDQNKKQQMPQTTQPTQPTQPQSPMKPMQPAGNKLAKILKAWGDEPGRINFGPGYEPPRLAEADKEEGMDLYHADEDENEEMGKELTTEEAHELGEKIGIDWDNVEFTVDAFLNGYKVELEHGSKSEETNVTDDNPEITGRIAWAHLKEDPEYYVKLKKMESGGQEVQAMRKRAITMRELQDIALPQLEEDFFQIDVSLQNSDLRMAREVLNAAASRFSIIKEKIDSLGDVDPMTFTPKEDGGFLSKLGL